MKTFDQTGVRQGPKQAHGQFTKVEAPKEAPNAQLNPVAGATRGTPPAGRVEHKKPGAARPSGAAPATQGFATRNMAQTSNGPASHIPFNAPNTHPAAPSKLPKGE